MLPMGPGTMEIHAAQGLDPFGRFRTLLDVQWGVRISVTSILFTEKEVLT